MLNQVAATYVRLVLAGGVTLFAGCASNDGPISAPRMQTLKQPADASPINVYAPGPEEMQDGAERVARLASGIRAAVATADRMTLTFLGISDCYPAVHSADRDSVLRFLAILEFEPEFDGKVETLPRVKLEFFRLNDRVARLDLIYLDLARNPSWDSDVYLTPGAGEMLGRWFADNGIPITRGCLGYSD